MIIEPAENGAVLEYETDWEESIKVRRVFEFDQVKGEFEGLINLLSTIIDQLGCAGGRYDEKRIQISLIHGDKRECDGCPICMPKGAIGE